MSRSLTTKEVRKDGAAVAIGAAETATAITEDFAISPGDSLAFEAAVTITGSNFTGANVNLYHSMDGSTFTEVGKTAVSMAGGAATYYVSFLAQASGDQADLPLRPTARLSVDSGAGADFSVDSVLITRRR